MGQMDFRKFISWQAYGYYDAQYSLNVLKKFSHGVSSLSALIVLQSNYPRSFCVPSELHDFAVVLA